MKKTKKTLLTLSAGLLIGGGTVYAASDIFGKLGEIRNNYDIVLQFGRNKKQEVAILQNQLNNATGDKDQLTQEIAQLKQEIENLKTSHAEEVTNKNSEIARKQEEINRKQEEVNEKQNTINQLNNELGELNGTLAQVEAEVDSLLNHTNAGVEELLNE